MSPSRPDIVNNMYTLLLALDGEENVHKLWFIVIFKIFSDVLRKWE